MNKSQNDQWKLGLLSLSALLASGAVAYASIENASASAPADVEQQRASATPNATSGATTSATSRATTTATTTPTPASGRSSGRPGGGRGHHDHLEGMNTNPPAVELVATPSTSEQTTQSTSRAAGADFYDGRYYGDAVNAGRWGQLQVVAVIEEGVLVDVLIANYPRSTYESDIITRNALPTLISEAIEAQDADIDFVSRATDSSRAFVQSLESALLDAAIGVDL